ncbi:MAG: hypothetical protein PUG60_10400 [Lachnospiraceae bacterium]|nr:hypothetical protein [Lachnospiraceae bacterium]
MVQININAIPEADMNVMARGLLASITAFYEDPENMRRFQEWERQQEEKNRKIETV